MIPEELSTLPLPCNYFKQFAINIIDDYKVQTRMQNVLQSNYALDEGVAGSVTGWAAWGSAGMPYLLHIHIDRLISTHEMFFSLCCIGAPPCL